MLQKIAPNVERYLAGKLASGAASTEAGLLARINPKELLKTSAQSAVTGAVVAPIENSASRYVQGQPTTFKDFQRDMTLGALLGGATPAAGKILQLPFRLMAPTSGSRIPKILRAPEYADTETAQRANASNRAAGRAEKPTSASSAASRGYTGSISQQQDRALADLTKANNRIDLMLDDLTIAAIPLSDSTNLANQLRSLAGYFKGSKDLDALAATAQKFAAEVDGKVAVDPKIAHEVKKFLDAARTQPSFKNDPSQLSAQAALVDLSNSVRSDLKTALPPIADLLDFESDNYNILDGLYKSGAKRPSVLSYADVATSVGLGGATGYVVDPELGVAFGAANLARKAIGNSPRARARLSNMINRAAGNEYDQIPSSQILPQRPPTRGLLGATKLGISAQSSAQDTSGVVPGYEPFVSRVQLRLPAGGSTSNIKTKGIQYNAGDPDAIPQSPPRTGGANQPGGFEGLESPGGVMTPQQVPFTGSAPVGGRPSRGEPRVRTMSSVRDPDVIVTPVPQRGVSSANVLEGEILPDRGLKAGEEVYLAAPPVRANNVETSVAKRERSAKKLRTAKPTVEDVQPATATVSKTAQAMDTPAEAAKEIESEVSRVIDVQGVTKAMEIKRRVLAALMEEMKPAKTAVAKWDTTGISAKGKRVNVPRPYTETIAITIPDDGTFRIPRTPEAITNLMKRITDASSTAWEGVGSIKTTKPVARPGRATW